MRITPLDIQQKIFPLRFRGFHAEEVSSFLELIREEIEDLLRENAALKEQLQKADEETGRFWAMKELLSRTLLEANQMAEEYKLHGRREADLLIETAEKNAEEMIGGYHEKALAMHEEIVTLKMIRKQFNAQTRSMLTDVYRTISDDEGNMNKEEINLHAFPGTDELRGRAHGNAFVEETGDVAPSHSEE